MMIKTFTPLSTSYVQFLKLYCIAGNNLLAGIKFSSWIPIGLCKDIVNLAVQYEITIHIYVSKKFWRILIWRLQRQTAKLNHQI